ncbi:hypothetical protein Nepgr_016404 [Nepenthes gracilis]|uniref:Secreted protein n=1 Tax=Nepenthes gracilis TaxID=150966 RepID=A0AAD3XRK8_NEPGR|nr:hypothetical protein Nepgr_016404 [Nepenthes gracilis]
MKLLLLPLLVVPECRWFLADADVARAMADADAAGAFGDEFLFAVHEILILGSVADDGVESQLEVIYKGSLPFAVVGVAGMSRRWLLCSSTSPAMAGLLGAPPAASPLLPGSPSSQVSLKLLLGRARCRSHLEREDLASLGRALLPTVRFNLGASIALSSSFLSSSRLAPLAERSDSG